MFLGPVLKNIRYQQVMISLQVVSAAYIFVVFFLSFFLMLVVFSLDNLGFFDACKAVKIN